MQDTARNLSYVFINEGDVYTAADGSQHSYVTIVNTQTQTVSLGCCAAPHGYGRERLWQQGQVRRHAISIPV